MSQLGPRYFNRLEDGMTEELTETTTTISRLRCSDKNYTVRTNQLTNQPTETTTTRFKLRHSDYNVSPFKVHYAAIQG